MTSTRRFFKQRLCGPLASLLFLLVVPASDCFGREPEQAAGAEPSASQQLEGGLAVVDWVIIGAYGLATIALGWYYGRRQQSTKEYFVGSGNMNPTLIGVSLFATLLSTISYLAFPGEILGKGPVFMLTILAFPAAYAIVAYGLLPVYMKQNVTSAYELLEARLGVGIRLLGASMFLVMRLVWMSLLIYLAAQAMSLMMYGDESHLRTIIWVAGFVSVFYASIGGLRAVVITDLMQTLLLFGGGWLVIAMVTYDSGGFGWFPTRWYDHWDVQPLYSFDPTVRITVFGSILSYLIWYVCTAGGDQVSVQRFMATTDLKTARRAYATQLTVSAIVQISMCLVGFALLGFYVTRTVELPPGGSLNQIADTLFPRFIAHELPVGISGLVVAAMFAAAMSSVDSGINSITAVVTVDFLERFGLQPRSESQQVLVARSIALAVGAAVVYFSSYIGQIDGNIVAVTNKTVNLLTPSLFALFVFALFVPFAEPIGVWIGTLGAILVSLCMAFSGPLLVFLADHWQVDPAIFGVEIVSRFDPDLNREVRVATKEISFQWYAVVTLIVNLGLGSAISWAISKRKRD